MTTLSYAPGAPAGARRKTMIAALVGALLASILAVLNPLGGTKAFAIDDGKDVNWYLGHGAAGYKNMIDAVRKRVGQKYVDSIDRTGAGGSFFTVNIYRADRSRTDGANIRVILDARDLYVQGVYDVDYSQYYRFRDARYTRYAPTAASGSRQYTFDFGGSYAEMARYAGGGFNMRSAQLGYANFMQVADTVASNGESMATRARGMIALVEAIAEGARFDYVSGRIHNSFMSGNPFRFNTEAEGLAKNWSGISKLAVKKVNAPTNRDEIRIGQLELDTLASIKYVLALILISVL